MATKADRLEFPADGVCPGCTNTEWEIIETGYQRRTSAEWKDDHLHAQTDGWDDLSESGDDEWAECAHCGDVQYLMPDKVAYD